MPSSETVTISGRILKASWISGLPVLGVSWLAVGDGSWSDKSNPPPVSASATTLTHEVARKHIQRAAWLALDNTLGTIWWHGNLYKEVMAPTPIVGLFADFTPDEASGVQICEEGVFAGEVVTSATPYALAAEVSQPGTLYWVRNRAVYTKNPGDTFTAVAVFEEK